MHQRGFTLLESAVAVAIVAATLLVAIPLAAGSRPAAAASSAAQFDAAVTYARSLASTGGNGATLVVSAAQNGFAMQLYSGRPTQTNALVKAMPVIGAAGDIREATLGAPPFALFFDSAGHASGMSGGLAPGSVIATDPGCPGTLPRMLFSISDARTVLTRALPCLQTAGSP